MSLVRMCLYVLAWGGYYVWNPYICISLVRMCVCVYWHGVATICGIRKFVCLLSKIDTQTQDPAFFFAKKDEKDIERQVEKERIIHKSFSPGKIDVQTQHIKDTGGKWEKKKSQ